MIAGFTGLPGMLVKADPNPAAKAQIRSNEDPRILSLRRFFQRHNSPAQSLSDVFVREADQNGLDWRLLPGLAMIESGGGKHCMRFNLFGWKNGMASFESFADGIRQVAWQLSNSRFYRYKSIDRVLLTYNKDPLYRKRVMSTMRGISPTVEIALLSE